MYLLLQLYGGEVLDIKIMAKKLNIIENSVRQDLLLLQKKGWFVAKELPVTEFIELHSRLLSI